jgi:holin-like protein
VLKGLLTLLVCQLTGEIAVRLTGIRIPGPVVGMLIFLLVLQWRKPGASSGLVEAPALLLRHLQLLFVPAGAGIVVYLDTLRDHAVPLAVGLVVSWLAGFTITAYAVAGLLRFTRGRR